MNGPIDKECVHLCNTLNMLKGIRTKHCCTGHKTDTDRITSYYILCACDWNLNMNQLIPIIQQLWPISPQYKRWHLTFSYRKWDDDPGGRCMCICLAANYKREELYLRRTVCEQARAISDSIRTLLEDKDFMSKYGIQTEKKPCVRKMNREDE